MSISAQAYRQTSTQAGGQAEEAIDQCQGLVCLGEASNSVMQALGSGHGLGGGKYTSLLSGV